LSSTPCNKLRLLIEEEIAVPWLNINRPNAFNTWSPCSRQGCKAFPVYHHTNTALKMESDSPPLTPPMEKASPPHDRSKGSRAMQTYIYWMRSGLSQHSRATTKHHCHEIHYPRVDSLAQTNFCAIPGKRRMSTVAKPHYSRVVNWLHSF
jgi:hypothetical protein